MLTNISACFQDIMHFFFFDKTTPFSFSMFLIKNFYPTNFTVAENGMNKDLIEIFEIFLWVIQSTVIWGMS